MEVSFQIWELYLNQAPSVVKLRRGLNRKVFQISPRHN